MKNKINIRAFIVAAAVLIPLAGMAHEPHCPAGEPLTFDRFLEEVAANNLGLLSESLNVSIAESEVTANKAINDPDLVFEGAEEYFSLDLEYTFELGKRTARVRLARSEAEYERLGLLWYFQQLRAEAADAYLDCMLQKELLECKLDSYRYMQQLSDFDSVRYSCGEITENDARQSKVEASLLLNEVIEQQGEYLAALARLGMYMAAESNVHFYPVATVAASFPEYDLYDLVRTGIENRIDLRAEAVGIEISGNNLRLARAERRPDIGVAVGYERDWSRFLPSRDMLRAAVTVPLRFSAANKGSLRAAQYTLDQSILRQAEAELQARTEISQCFYRYQSLRRQMELFQRNLMEESGKILDGYSLRYRRGESDIIDVLLAQRDYTEVRERYLETQKSLLSSLVELQTACGIWDISL